MVLEISRTNQLLPAATASDQQWLLSCISIIQVAVTTIEKRCGDFGVCPRASYPAGWSNQAKFKIEIYSTTTFKAQPFTVGLFHIWASPHCVGIPPILRVPQAISRRPESAHRPAKFDSFLVSVLKKSARTSPAEHTQKPSCDKQLPLMRRIGFDAWTTYCNSRTR